MAEDKQQKDLCQAGKVLEIKFNAGINSLKESAGRMEVSCGKVSAAVQQLKEYAIRDKERIDSLEKSKDCKSKKLKEIQHEKQKLEILVAKHLGEHKEMKRQEGLEGKKWGILSGGGVAGLIEIGRRILEKIGN